MKTTTQQPHLTSPKGRNFLHSTGPHLNPLQRRGLSFAQAIAGAVASLPLWGSRRGLALALCTMLFSPLLWKGIGAEVSAQNIGISATGATPDNSAMLDVVSTTKGMLIPRMTGTEKYAITSPATGLLIFQTDTVGFWYYDGSKWIPLLSSTSSTSGSTGGWGLSGNSSTSASNFLGTTDNISLRIKTNDTTRVIVDSLGRVGIGTTSPGSLLHVYGGNISVQGSLPSDVWGQVVGYGYTGTSGTTQGIIGHQGFHNLDLFWNFYRIAGTANYTGLSANGFTSANAISLGNSGITFHTISTMGVVKPTERMRITNDGNVGIGCTAPQYKLHVIGDIASSATIRGVNAYVTGAITACSDLRYKKDIIPLPNALSNVMKLQGVNYHWKTKEFPEKNFTNEKQIGFIAQEIEKIYPEVVMTDKDGYKSVDYSRLTPVLVEAIKEQQKIIGSMQLAMDNQQKINDYLKTKSEKSEIETAQLKAVFEKLVQIMNTEEARR